MRSFSRTQKALILIYTATVVVLCHHFIVRPRLLDWGSTEAIRTLHLAGDNFTMGTSHTRAVLVEASPEAIWPWLLQMGQERGGFYSYQKVENLFRAEMKNSYVLRLDLQHARLAGDTVWLASRKNWKSRGFQVIAEIKPLESYVMVGDKDFDRIQHGDHASGSWAFYIYPETTTTTWLIARSSDGDMSWRGRLLRYVTFEVPHAIMEIRMLKTIKRLAEENKESGRPDIAQDIDL